MINEQPFFGMANSARNVEKAWMQTMKEQSNEWQTDEGKPPHSQKVMDTMSYYQFPSFAQMHTHTHIHILSKMSAQHTRSRQEGKYNKPFPIDFT